jgi:hypothetical protein
MRISAAGELREAAMDRFEYKIAPVYWRVSREELLKSEGLNGWELVAVESGERHPSGMAEHNTPPVFYFRRKITAPVSVEGAHA